MTDTPRTQAELLDIFQDGQNGTITAQDMRDLVVSSAVGPTYANLSTRSVNGGTTAIAVPSNSSAYVLLPYGSGIASGATETAWGTDYFDQAFTQDADDPDNAYSLDMSGAFMLPTGIWSWTLGVGFSPSATFPDAPSSPLFTFFDQMRFDPDFVGPLDGSVPWAYDWYMNSVDYSQRIPTTGVAGTYTGLQVSGAVIQDKPDPQPFGVSAVTSSGAPGVTINAYNVQFWRTA